MNRFITALASVLLGITLQAQSSDYNPTNPPDPGSDTYNHYRLEVTFAPAKAGYTDFSLSKLYQAGQSIYLRAYPYTGYKFKCWMAGDSLLSESSSFYFTMPYHDEVVTAHFDIAEYNPSNPGDPWDEGYKHKVTVYSSPSAGGSSNGSSYYVTEGREEWLYAYPNNGFRFSSWKKDDKIISTENPLHIVMGEEDMEFTATFVYDPQSPKNPGANNYDEFSGSLIIDDFEPGLLTTSIWNLLGDYTNYDNIQTITVCGLLDNSDLGFHYRLKNLAVIDLARTTGMTAVPRYNFSDLQKLQKIILPASVQRIGSYALTCPELSEVCLYAPVPPELDPQALDTASGNIVIRVPSSALSLYAKDENWCKFTILPLDDEMCALEVALPSDAADGRYKNMSLELKSQTSGQTISFVITDRTSYTFSGLVPDSRYNVSVKSRTGALLGSINDIEVGKDNAKVAFESLRQPCSVSLTVKSAQGKDITERVAVTWTDADGRYLARGASLQGVIEGESVGYTVTLPDDLAAEYMIPETVVKTISPDVIDFEYTLQPYETAVLSGTVLNSVNGLGLPGATVTVSQQTEGAQSRTFSAITDAQGSWSVTALRRPAKVTVAFGGYVSQSVDCNPETGTLALDPVSLRKATGYEVNMDISHRVSVAAGEQSEPNGWFSDNDKARFALYDRTAGRAIDNFSLQYPRIVILDPVQEGHEISVTVSASDGSFNDVAASFTSNRNGVSSVTLPIVERGSLQADFDATDARNVAAMIYGPDGRLVRKGSFTDGTYSSGRLPDGKYTFVAMATSRFFNSSGSLDELAANGLTAGTDFVSAETEVKSGAISSLHFNSVPTLDESRFYYTTQATMFSANKASVTVGNYVTIKAKLDFLPQYSSKVNDVKLIFTIPEGCSMVENSMMAGTKPASYSLDGKTVAIDLPQPDALVKFCIIPEIAGTVEPSATATFAVGNERVSQPIGTAAFKASNMSIYVPERTPLTNVVVNGVAMPGSNIEIFDNDVLVGNTTALASGKWKTAFELHKPFSSSVHEIRAGIKATDGKTFTSDSKLLDYDKRYTVLQDVRMVYNYYDISFDPVNGTTSTNTYSYVPGNSKFTFIATFEGNASQLDNFRFRVLASDGAVTSIPAVFNEKLNSWAATASYPHSYSIPVNVTVDYDEIIEGATDRTESFADQMAIMKQCSDAIKKATEDKVTMDMIEDADDHMTFTYNIDGLDNGYRFTMREIPYDEVSAMMSEKQFYPTVLDGEKIAALVEYDDAGIILYLVGIDEKTAFVAELTDPEWNAAAKAPKINWKGMLNALRKSTTNGSFIQGLGDLGSTILDVFGIGTYISCHSDFQLMCYLIELYSERNIENQNDLTRMILAKCADGSYRLTREQMNSFDKRKQALNTAFGIFEEQAYNYLEDYKRALMFRLGYDLALMGAGKAIGKATKSTKFQNSKPVKWAKKLFSKGVDDEGAAGICGTVIDYSFAGATGLIDKISNPSLGDFESIKDEYNSWARKKHIEHYDAYLAIYFDILYAYKYCKPEKPNDDNTPDNDPDPDNIDFPTPPLSPAIDPAGFVYEAVVSNRLEGVTATAYYKEMVEDMYGDVHEEVVLWNAEEYAQKNPLFTDENGMYAWDVPQGLWQVKFEKEGYETTHSEWLPVPPPQLEVNVGMTQMRQPEVLAAHAYADAVTVEFDKYMIPSTLTADNVFFTVGGKTVEGNIELENEESGWGDDSRTFASRIRFKAAAPFDGKEVSLTISARVQSYAGVRMAETFVQALDVEPELTVIDIPDQVELVYGEQISLDVRLLSAEAGAGKTLCVATASDMVATTDAARYTADKDGNVSVAINGELPGATVLTFTVEGYDISKALTVNVLQSRPTNAVSKPTASVEPGKVPFGTEVFLYCATEEATIYYTLDGSCPCDADRLTYDGQPIVLTADTTLKIMAEADGMDNSEIVEYVYTIDNSGIVTIEAGKIADEPCYDLNGYPVDPTVYRGIIVCRGVKYLVR